MTLKELTDKVLIGIPTLFHNPNYKGKDGLWKNWIECENTWVPLLRKKGFNVIYLVSNEFLNKDYKYNDPFLSINCTDDELGFFKKTSLGPFKYVMEQTNYEYFFRIDNDCFVHPERFVDMLADVLSRFDVDYLGAHYPRHPEIDPCVSHQQEIYNFNSNSYYGFASGAAFMVSRKSMKKVLEQYIWSDLPDDLRVSDILKANQIPLLNDTRICYDSPYYRLQSIPGKEHPFIGQSFSHLAIQHYCNGKMKEIQSILNLGL